MGKEEEGLVPLEHSNLSHWLYAPEMNDPFAAHLSGIWASPTQKLRGRDSQGLPSSSTWQRENLRGQIGPSWTACHHVAHLVPSFLVFSARPTASPPLLSSPLS